MSTINQDGTQVLIEAVYYRYHSIYIEQHDTIEEAQQSLDGGEDMGEISSVGVFVDGEPHSSGPWDWSSPEPGDGVRQLDGMRREYAKTLGLVCGQLTVTMNEERETQP